MLIIISAENILKYCISYLNVVKGYVSKYLGSLNVRIACFNRRTSLGFSKIILMLIIIVYDHTRNLVPVGRVLI